MSKRILVTGGTGFIGSHLCKELLENGHNVICVDNFYTGNIKNLDDIKSNKNFEIIEHDIINPMSIYVDEIYNLACPASPVHYQYNPVETVKTNVLGTLNMLELACKMNAKILQASTSEVYGDPKVHPQKETYWGNVNPIGKRACYDEGKRCAETLFFDYHRQKKVSIKVVRIFNTYGPNMHPNDGRVVSNFIVQALKRDDITINGTGDQTRSFCYIDDMIKGLVSMMDNENLTGPINLGNPIEMTILELADRIIELTNSKSKIIYNSLPEDDPIRRNPDITLAKKKLNWEPKIPLNEGLLKTIEYFRKII